MIDQMIRAPTSTAILLNVWATCPMALSRSPEQTYGLYRYRSRRRDPCRRRSCSRTERRLALTGNRSIVFKRLFLRRKVASQARRCSGREFAPKPLHGRERSSTIRCCCAPAITTDAASAEGAVAVRNACHLASPCTHRRQTASGCRPTQCQSRAPSKL